MLRFVITLATAAAFIAGADLANAGGGAGALPQSILDYPTDAYAYAQKTTRISKGPRGQAAPSAFVVEPQSSRIVPNDELYGTACQHPFKTAFSCPGSGM